MNEITDEEVSSIQKTIERDTLVAAYNYIRAMNELNQLRAAMYTIRTFAQNTHLAKEGNKSQIEFALGRKIEG